MPDTIPLEIITPTRVLYSGDVTMFRAPGTSGLFQVLPMHHPLMSTLEIGKIDYRDTEGNDHVAATSGGYVEVTKSGITVLATTAEFASEIDVERAQEALERAKAHLSGGVSGDTIEQRMDNQSRAELAVKRAMNRLQLLSKGI